MTPSRRSFAPGALLVVLAAAWVASTWPLLSVAADSLRLAAVFQPDEQMHVNLLRHALSGGTMALAFGSYGHLYFNAVLLPLHALHAVAPVSDEQILLGLRTLSFLGGGATVLLVAVWARREAGLVAGLVGGLLVLLSPPLAVWSGLSHPDTLQVFFLTLALYLCRRLMDTFSVRGMVGAAAVAGLAFACKFAGVFVLPLLAAIVLRGSRPVDGVHGARLLRAGRGLVLAAGAAALLVAFWMTPERVIAALTEDGHADDGARAFIGALRTALAVGGAVALAGAAAPVWRWRPWLAAPVATAANLAVAGVAFAGALSVASPYSWRKLAMLKGLYFEATRLGAAAPAGSALASWGQVALTDFGPLLLAATPAALVGCWLMQRRGSEPAGGAVALLTAWVALFGLVLAARIRVAEPHYALPLLPALAWLGGYASARLAEALPARRLAAPLLVAVVLGLAAPRYVDARHRFAHRVDTSGAVAGGRWLSCAVAPAARVAYDYMAYVPPEFRDARPTWGGTEAWLTGVSPDVVVTRASVELLYASGPGTEATRAYYACLRSGACGFERWFGNAEVEIFGRAGRVDLRKPCASIGQDGSMAVGPHALHGSTRFLPAGETPAIADILHEAVPDAWLRRLIPPDQGS